MIFVLCFLAKKSARENIRSREEVPGLPAYHPLGKLQAEMPCLLWNRGSSLYSHYGLKGCIGN